MDPDIIEFRIQELEHERVRLAQQMDKLEDRRREIKGAIAEMWKWFDTVKDAKGYGQTTWDGKAKVLKVPVFGSPDAIKQGIENRETAIDGEDHELVAKIRMDKARGQSRKLIKEMDGANRTDADTLQERPSSGEPGPFRPEP